MGKPFRELAFSPRFVARFYDQLTKKVSVEKKAAPQVFNRWWDLNRDKFSVRCLKIEKGETFDQALSRFLAEMPRKPFKFLAMVAELERARETKARVASRKEAGRRKYQKRMRRHEIQNR